MRRARFAIAVASVLLLSSGMAIAMQAANRFTVRQVLLAQKVHLKGNYWVQNPSYCPAVEPSFDDPNSDAYYASDCDDYRQHDGSEAAGDVKRWSELKAQGSTVRLGEITGRVLHDRGVAWHDLGLVISQQTVVVA